MAKNLDLGAFLRSRRARLGPADVGLAPGGPRRVPGLRREEVALLAGVSLDYYARLEQGRDLQPSDQVLEAVARALRLTDPERDHLRRLVRARVADSGPEGRQVGPLDAGARLLLDSIDVPGIILDQRGDVHAVNRVGRALLVGLKPLPSRAANHTRWLFLDPSARDLLVDWAPVARASVGVLRLEAGRHPGDPALHALVGELSVASPEFRTWWAGHDVDDRCAGPKRFRHPVVGEMVLHVEALRLRDGERWLYTYAAEPGSPSLEALRLLGAWAATEDAEAGPPARLADPSALDA